MPFSSLPTRPAEGRLEPTRDSVVGELDSWGSQGWQGSQHFSTPSFQGLKPEVGTAPGRLILVPPKMAFSQPADPTPGLWPLQLLSVP